MAEPPFLGLEEPKAEVCFQSSGAPGVFSEFGTIGSVFGVQGYQEGKCAVVPRKL